MFAYKLNIQANRWLCVGGVTILTEYPGEDNFFFQAFWIGKMLCILYRTSTTIMKHFVSALTTVMLRIRAYLLTI